MRVYKLPVVVVPTNVPAVRADLPLEVYPSARGKFGAVAREVLAMTRAGRPVLVGTTSVSSSEVLSDILTANGISHNLLNARPQYAALEAEIIAQAGRFGAITISTNMAGRGTDILLGGNAEMLAGTMLRKYLDPMLCPPGPAPPAPGPDDEAAPPPVTQVLPPVHCSRPTYVLLAQAQKAGTGPRSYKDASDCHVRISWSKQAASTVSVFRCPGGWCAFLRGLACIQYVSLLVDKKAALFFPRFAAASDHTSCRHNLPPCPLGAARAAAPLDPEAAAALVARATELGLERSLRPHWERHVAAPHEMPARLDALPREGDAAGASEGEQTAERRQLLFWMGAAYYALHKVRAHTAAYS